MHFKAMKTVAFLSVFDLFEDSSSIVLAFPRVLHRAPSLPLRPIYKAPETFNLEIAL